MIFETSPIETEARAEISFMDIPSLRCQLTICSFKSVESALVIVLNDQLTSNRCDLVTLFGWNKQFAKIGFHIFMQRAVKIFHF